ncbi:MAG TPA: NAD(P)/FAD-dependent oxidoreductase [Thermoplasmatales archaeon]|nr:NAD(P)/FAD-dependent oxidoreductase [Thermoplasmatales archaeon]
MKTSYDVAVIGGGPIGSNIAASLSQKGYNVVVIEQKKEIGVPLQCAGLVSKRVFNLVDIPLESVMQNKLYGAYLHSPRDRMVQIGDDKPHAFAIDRVTFDKRLAEQAQERGAEYLLNTRAYNIKRKENAVEIQVKHCNETFAITSKLLIGADGSKSTVRKIFNFPQPQEMLLGAGAEVEHVDLDPKFVHVFLGREIAPGFFAWIIPINRDGTKARIGLCSTKPLSKTLKSYFTTLFNYPSTRPFLEQAVVTRFLGGSIPLGVLRETVADNVMLVGDAAAQVKPLSGGGIYTGLLSSKHCTSVAEEALEENNLTRKRLREYYDLWTQELKREIMFGMRVRRRYVQMNDEEIENHFTYLQDDIILSIISQYGDIDYPSRLVFPLVRSSPKLLRLLPKFIHLFL